MIEVGSRIRLRSELECGIDKIYIVHSIPYPGVDNPVVIVHPTPQHHIMYYESEIVEIASYPIKVIRT